MTLLDYPALILEVIHVLIVFGIMIRVIMRRPAIGVALAWLILVAAIPYLGAIAYLMIGERRIGDQRLRRIDRLREDKKALQQLVAEQEITNVDWSRHPPAAQYLDRLGYNLIGVPTVSESDCEIIHDAQRILQGIREDIDGAQKSVLMEFYIWNEGGEADAVLDALIRAAGRGVQCRVLIDALGARPWWRGAQPERLRAAGVQLQTALPVGFFRTFIGRADLRLHRKMVVIDANFAWTGSMNMVDPLYFKQNAGVGNWVDAMVRLQGRVVIPLMVTLAGDWSVETGEPVLDVIAQSDIESVAANGKADIQVIPSGPSGVNEGLLQMLLGLINAARHELILTTPYLVPDESLLKALRGAAGRGVQVSIIVPEKVDSFFTRYASRSYFDHLLDSDIAVYLYRGGLLHTKSIMVDQHISMFGTANFDMRSLWLNYELSLFIYHESFARNLNKLQRQYIKEAHRLVPEHWENRSIGSKLLENVMRLMSPLL